MRVVLDTNVFVSGIFWKGAPFTLLQRWTEGRFRIVITEKILDEYSRVLHELDPREKVLKRWMLFLVKNADVVEDRDIVKVCRDPFDDMFINCALTAKARYLISGDKDILVLKNY